MSESGSSQTALARVDRSKEKIEMERRRALVADLRFHKQLTLVEIADELARQDPPIKVTIATISRDVDFLRMKVKRAFRVGDYDARTEFGIMIASIKAVAGRSFRKADLVEESDGKEAALHRKVGLDAMKQLYEMLADVGLIDKRDFMLPPDEDGKKAERLPSGDELRKQFESINVIDAEVTSVAERAWMYGDDIGGSENGSGT